MIPLSKVPQMENKKEHDWNEVPDYGECENADHWSIGLVVGVHCLVPYASAEVRATVDAEDQPETTDFSVKQNCLRFTVLDELLFLFPQAADEPQHADDHENE